MRRRARWYRRSVGRRPLALLFLTALGCGTGPAVRATSSSPAEESLVGAHPRALDEARARELDAFIEHARVTLGVPGASIAIVAGNELVHEQAFGERALGSAAPVTPDTLFLIGSITKSMTTMMQAALVDAGTVRWDAPLSQLLPDFAVGDAALTERLVLWHMGCGCTGMPQQDVETLLEYEAVSPEARLASMRGMQPTAPFGTTYQYSNLMLAAGGFAAAHAFAPDRPLDDAYAAALAATVLEPIGMTRSTLDFAVVESTEHALPHGGALDGTTREMPLAIEHMVTPIAPAGAVWSTAQDMARYAITELQIGVAPGGRRVVSTANVLERRVARVDTADGSRYGVGVWLGTRYGVPILEPAGSSFGFRSQMVLLPDHGVAVVVLTNTTSAGGDFTEIVQRRALETLFAALEDRAGRELAERSAARTRAVADAAASVEASPDAAWLESLAGTYAHPALGSVELRADGTLDVGEWQSRFGRHRAADGTSYVVLLDPPLAGGPIAVGGDDARRTLRIDEPPHPYELVRAQGAGAP